MSISASNPNAANDANALDLLISASHGALAARMMFGNGWRQLQKRAGLATRSPNVGRVKEHRLGIWAGENPMSAEDQARFKVAGDCSNTSSGGEAGQMAQQSGGVAGDDLSPPAADSTTGLVDVTSWRDYITKLASKFQSHIFDTPRSTDQPRVPNGTPASSDHSADSLALTTGRSATKAAGMPQVPTGALSAPIPGQQPGMPVTGQPRPLPGAHPITQAPTSNPVAAATGASTVGPGNSPSVNPIGSFGPLGAAPGTVTGNSAFGQQHNKTGVCRELLVLLSGEKQARVEPMPRWKSPASNPIAWDNVQRHIYHDLAKSLGMAFDADGQLYDTFAVNKNSAAHGVDGEGGYYAKTGERCQHCFALHERGDDGKCNCCGKEHDHPAYKAAGCLSLGEARAAGRKALDEAYVRQFHFELKEKLGQNTAEDREAHAAWERKHAESGVVPLLKRAMSGYDCVRCGGRLNIYGECLSCPRIKSAAGPCGAQGAEGEHGPSGAQPSPPNHYVPPLQPVLFELTKQAMNDWYANGGKEESHDEKWDRKLRRLWERRDPEGLEEGNPYGELFRAWKQAGLLDSPVAPYVVRPAVGAGLGLGINEIMRLIAKARGAQPSDEDVRRDRIMAGSMGAGIGMGQAAAPLIGKVVFGD